MKAERAILLAAIFLLFTGGAASAAVNGPVAARDLVLDTLLAGDTAGRMLSVHPDLLPAGTAVKTWRDTVLITPAAGYVVFVDDMALASFEHPCRYVFVDASTGALAMTDARTPPLGMEAWLSMETEAWLAMMNGRNVRAPRTPTPRRGAPKTPKGGEYYAVLMSGGASSGSNHVRYWNDLSNIYITLVDVYAYKDQNIIVLCSDGLDPAPDQSNGLNSHPDLDGDGDDDIMYSCIKSNIQLVFAQLAGLLTPADQLFVFTTDHGGSNGGWNTYLNLWNQEELADSELEAMYAALPACNVITTMEQCYSGGFLDNLSQNLTNQVFSSAARYDELSWAMPPNYEYDTYVFFWTAAVKGEDAYGVPCDADLNKDGSVSMHEAFLYAEANDFSNETPQYNSNPSLLGEDLVLGPGPALSMRIQAGQPAELTPPGPSHTLTVQIKAGTETYLPGTGYLHYRYAPGDPWTDVALTPLGSDQFEATLPATRPGDQPEYYFSGRGSLGSTVYLPAEAPTTAYAFDVCLVETIFSEDFETGGFGPMWTVQTTVPARVQVTKDNDPRDAYHVTMDSSVSGTYCTGSMTLTLNLSGVTDADLTFWFKEFSDETHTEDNVSISEDGVTWHTAMSLEGTSSYAEKFIDLDAEASAAGITLNSTFRIRWQWYDNYPIPTDGFAFDDIRIESLDYAPSFWADGYAFSGPAGCSIALLLDAGASFAGRDYAVVGGLSGTRPGTPLPGGKVLPVNWDWLSNFMLYNPSTPVFPNCRGRLDGQGAATAGFVLAGPGASAYVGQILTFAYALPASFDFVSNPIFIGIEP